MPVQLKCPTCGAALSVRETTRAFVCPSCKGGVVIDQNGTPRGASLQEVQALRAGTREVSATHGKVLTVEEPPPPPELHAWQLLLACGWFATLLGAMICVINGSQASGAFSVTWWVVAGGFLMVGLANHTFCRLCQHVQEIRDHLKSHEQPSVATGPRE